MTDFQDRPDLTPNLIHFTKGKDHEAAFDVLVAIVADRQLLGGSGYIRGEYRCVCFTEAPLDHLAEVFGWTVQNNLRYKPFGVLVSKQWLFEQGGRPVIYQPEEEFECLPNELRYRHVRLDLRDDNSVDFTWEREWRIRTDALPLDPQAIKLVLPSSDYADRLKEIHQRHQDQDVDAYRQVVGDAAALYEEPFSWKTIVLDDLRPDWHYADAQPEWR